MSEEKENLLFAENQPSEDILFAEEENEPNQTEDSWKILIVDDDAEVHKVTKLALKNFYFEGKNLTFFSAYSASAAKELILNHPDIAMILLDIVMEKDDTGLELVKFIRQSLNNEVVWIIIRTGQPGKAPETTVILNYDINDYKTKTELTKPKLVTSVVTALRSYNALTKLENDKVKIEKIAQKNAELYQQKKEYADILEAIVKDSTEELRAKEARLAEAQRLAHLGSWEYDVVSHKLTWSDELFRIFGRNPQEKQPVLEECRKQIHPDDYGFWFERLSKALELGEDYEFDFRIVRLDGSVRYVFTKGQAIKDADGRVIKIFGMVQDVTDRKEAEAALQKALEAAEVANRAKNQFIANMSHELRTPLNGILGYAQILQRDKNATPKQRSGFNVIYQCGIHLLSLINDILDIAKIEAQKIELNPTDFLFSNFLAEVREICRLRAAEKQITFNYEPSAELPTAIRADKRRLQQVLINLLSNAIKFTDTGSVTLRVEAIGQYSPLSPPPSTGGDERGKFDNKQLTICKIRFQVEDTGIGMTPQELDRIFLPFEQVADTSRRGEGIGLGLAIAQQIAYLMGSKILVESTPGVGSVFTFYVDFPLGSRETDRELEIQQKNIVGFQGEKRKVLIIDDRWENRAVITNMLAPIGFEVIEASNGQEGLSQAATVRPDLIITNLVMPVMDGFEMTQRLRSLPEFRDAIVIASSASVYDVDRQRSRESGCNDFLAKPVQADELFLKLQNYLQLEWIVESAEESLNGDKDTAALIAPPPSELIALYNAAEIGDIAAVEAEAIRLQQLSLQYVAFAAKLLQLAQEFEEEELINLVERYMPKQ